MWNITDTVKYHKLERFYNLHAAAKPKFSLNSTCGKHALFLSAYKKDWKILKSPEFEFESTTDHSKPGFMNGLKPKKYS